MLTKQFLSNFSDYNDQYVVNGVRIPPVVLDKKTYEDLGLDPSSTEDEVLRHLCRLGYKNKGIHSLPNRDEYVERINKELDTLKSLGFSRYILMVWDLVRWCDEQEIPRGWGRGSVSGSIVSWLTGITALDPIKYSLLFERFLNETRAKIHEVDGVIYADGGSVPDIDTDLSYIHRERVIKDYLEVKYPNRTCHIATINTLSTKLVLKEVCKKAGGYTETEAGKVSGLVESVFGSNQSLDETIKNNVVFEAWAKSEPDLLNIAKKLCDLPRNFGVHAAGIVVSYDPIYDCIPYEKRVDAEGREKIVTSYTKKDAAEQVIKLDALGLKVLDVIYTTAKEAGVDLNTFNHEDQSIYDFLQDFNYTYGVFQLDGDTAARVTRQVKPKSIDQISAVSAIARPGALQFLKRYLNYLDTGEIESIYGPIDDILRETGGVIIYQEQIMAIAVQVFGFSLTDADVLRKVIGDKLRSEVGKWEERIFEAGKKRGVPEEATKTFWDSCNASADYLFNKSHSVLYSYISTICVYLKKHYPALFFKNCLVLAKTYGDSEARMLQIYKELPHFGVKILPPDLRKSGEDFTVEGNVIRYGLKSIKSVNEKTLIKVKEFVGEYTDKLQMFEAASEAKLGIGVLTNLIRAGCFGSLGENRGKLVLEAQTWNLLSAAQKTKIQKHGKAYDYDLLRMLLDVRDGKLTDGGKEIISTKKRKTAKGERSPWDTFYDKYLPLKSEYARYVQHQDFYNYYYEQDTLGFSFSSSLNEILKKKDPLYEEVLDVAGAHESEIDSVIVCAGVIQVSKIGKTKKGNKMLSIDLADETGVIHCKVFNSTSFDKATYQTTERNNVDNIQETYGRFPAKKDIVVVRGTKKENVIFIDKLKILNEEYKL